MGGVNVIKDQGVRAPLPPFTEEHEELRDHGGKKNPQGVLLGFDHAGRGYTMMEDWKAPTP